MEETMNLSQLFKQFRKGIGWFVGLTIGGALIGGIIAYLILTPQYTSQSQLIVKISDTNNSGKISAGLAMINTYKDFVTSDVVVKEVKQELSENENLQLSKKAIKNSLEVNQSPSSQMFTIEATATDKKEAAKIANTTVAVFKTKIRDVLEVKDIKTVSKATPANQASFPNHLLIVGMATLLGLLLGFIVAAFKGKKD
ncbi:YveK family protein [Enterococcus alishanensis]|uniref:Capsular polysaccharide biosynthesis protein CpsC n=1 Tax=Enterococcus alishanensis TaxID=1303817 RepID=A0ABS6TCK1_9ENTE|nr:Wzz/FepE/Etk N-terminal domain-containing protein [Enterococcus alishanensis]MBV7390636.1 tyrosine protein kinase [Enterococcus alishanensis]